MTTTSAFWKSKTGLLGLAGFLAGITTAIVSYVEYGDWTAAVIAGMGALLAALKATERDASEKQTRDTVASNLIVAEHVSAAVRAAAPSPPPAGPAAGDGFRVLLSAEEMTQLHAWRKTREADAVEVTEEVPLL